MAFSLPALPYTYDALEPHLDALTMEIHHSRHHQTYVNGLNSALQDSPYANWSLTRLLTDIQTLPVALQLAVRNHGGGHANHSLFWQVMTPDGGGMPEGALLRAIEQAFGSFDSFKQCFIAVCFHKSFNFQKLHIKKINSTPKI